MPNAAGVGWQHSNVTSSLHGFPVHSFFSIVKPEYPKGKERALFSENFPPTNWSDEKHHTIKIVIKYLEKVPSGAWMVMNPMVESVKNQ